MPPPPACTPETRNQNLQALASDVFDVLILGGGINGAGVLRDIALRSKLGNLGLRVGLVEKGQFGSGTSGRNSHLIHGGLRYLKRLDVRLVREALHERSLLLTIAPHQVTPLPLLLPFEELRSELLYRTGLWMYDALAGKQNIGRHRVVRKQDLATLQPAIDPGHFRSAAIFYDCRMQAARLVLENVWDGIANGGVAANYIEVLDSKRNSDGVWTITLRDLIRNFEFTTRAKHLVDATGSWMNSEALRLVRGSHLILPQLTNKTEAVAYFEPDGRIIFFVPWGTNLDFTLVGTTDVDHAGGPDNVRISSDEVQYLLSIAHRVFRAGAVGHPISSFSSLRPLVREEGESATSTSREHRIWTDEDGRVRITGGKYTTYRLMSEEAVEKIYPDSKHLRATASHPLQGNSVAAMNALLHTAPEKAREHGMSQEKLEFLMRSYGVQFSALERYLPEFGEDATTAYAARHEMAQHVRDVLFVSTTSGYEQSWDRSSMLTQARALGTHLQWTPEEIEAEAEHTLQFYLESVAVNA